MSGSSYEPSGGIKIDRGLQPFGWERTGFYERGDERDNAVPTHGTIAFIMHKEDTQVRFGCHVLSQHRSVHIPMPSWLPHQGASNMVELRLHKAPAFQYGRTW